MGGAKRALRSFAASHLRPIDRVMVLTINGVGNLTQTTHWTSSKDEILKALDQAEQSSTGNKNFEKREAA